MNNSIGNIFRVTTFGESHGKAIGCIIDGCPAGIKLNKQVIQKELDKRRPGTTKYVTPRKEEDKIKILSGIYKKRTCGTPIGIIVKNKNVISKDYSNIKNLFRPGHADLTYKLKYKIRDHRGGGRSSARTTISLVIAGAIAKKILKKFFNIKIFCYIKRIGKVKIKTDKYIDKIESFFCPEKKTKKKIIKLLNKIIKSNNSIGCKLNINIKGIMPGIGDPLYEKLDSNITKSIMNLNAVKSVEIGKGKKSSKTKGSKNNDMFYKEGFLSNNSGGFLGGISTGQEINIKVYIKPTSSILKEQTTINNKNKEKKIKTKGRHDPCVGLRAAPILESICSINIIESILKQKTINFY